METITPETQAKLMAYISKHTVLSCTRVGIKPKQLRQMSYWITGYIKQIRTLRHDTLLNLHLSILCHAKLICEENGRYILTSQAYSWLNAPYEEKLIGITNTLSDPSLSPIIGELSPLYLTYHLQQANKIKQSQPQRTKIVCTQLEPQQISLHIPSSCSPEVIFHVLHYGTWQPDTQTITLTVASLLNAKKHGYSSSFLIKTVEEFLDPCLPKIKTTIQSWERQQKEVELLPVWLLQTKSKERMQQLRGNKTINRHVKKQLSPTHALVATAIEKPLKKTLAKNQVPFNPLTQTKCQPQASEGVYEAAWLGIALAEQLTALMPSPPKIKKATRLNIMEQIDPHTRQQIEDQAEVLVEKMLARPKESNPINQQAYSESYLVHFIETAIEATREVVIYYQGRQDDFPAWRTVSPLLVHKLGARVYLNAYCHVAEDTRQFRLDRIHKIKPVSLDYQRVSELSLGIETYDLNALLAFAD